jgi:DNA-binding transcriptional MocR family regulator
LLETGWPSPSLLPISLLNASASAILQTHLDPTAETIASLQYAPDPGPYTLRKALAEFLSIFFNAYTTPVPISHVVTTGGASQSLGVALTVVSDPKYTRAWLLEPTYFLAAGIFADLDLKAEGVDFGPGWDLSGLRKRIKEVEGERSQEVRYLLMTLSAVHPIEFIMLLAMRVPIHVHELVSLAVASNALLHSAFHCPVSSSNRF